MKTFWLRDLVLLLVKKIIPLCLKRLENKVEFLTPMALELSLNQALKRGQIFPSQYPFLKHWFLKISKEEVLSYFEAAPVIFEAQKTQPSFQKKPISLSQSYAKAMGVQDFQNLP